MIYCEFCGNPTEFVSVGRVAQLFGVQKKPVREWIRHGRFPGTVKVQGFTGGVMYKVPVTAIIPQLEARKEADE